MRGRTNCRDARRRFWNPCSKDRRRSISSSSATPTCSCGARLCSASGTAASMVTEPARVADTTAARMTTVRGSDRESAPRRDAVTDPGRTRCATRAPHARRAGAPDARALRGASSPPRGRAHALLRVDDAHGEAHVTLARVHLAEGAHAEARRALDAAAANDFRVRETTSYAVVSANCRAAEGDAAGALRELEAAMALPGIRHARCPRGRPRTCARYTKNNSAPISVADRARRSWRTRARWRRPGAATTPSAPWSRQPTPSRGPPRRFR